MFNFFNEIKTKFKSLEGKVAPFQTVLLGNFLLYCEGFVSLMTYKQEVIVFKVKNGVITVNGKDLTIKEMTNQTITVQGQITSWEYL